MMDEEMVAVLETLGKLDSQDSGISFDVKTKKSNTFQNVHVNIPAWALALGTLIGGATTLMLINEVVKGITGEDIWPDMPEVGTKAGVSAGARKAFDPLGIL